MRVALHHGFYDASHTVCCPVRLRLFHIDITAVWRDVPKDGTHFESRFPVLAVSPLVIRFFGNQRNRIIAVMNKTVVYWLHR